MANNIIKRVWNQNKMVNIEGLSGAAFQAESGGHTFQISGIDDTGATVALSGTVTGVFRRPDNADIALTGSASGGVASVTLTDDCYAVPGRFGLTIFVTSGGQKTAVYAAIGTVASTNGGAVAGDTPQDVVDLINAIAAAVATIPASYTDLMAAIAPTYSGSALYSVGSYAWYNGSLYRCTTAITTAETWTAAHWTVAVIGNDVSDLKSALPNYVVADEVYPSANGLTFSGNTSQSDPLVVTINNIYFMRNIKYKQSSYPAYANRQGGTYTIPDGKLLAFDFVNRTLSIEDYGVNFSTEKVCLLLKIGTYISGRWQVYYEKALRENLSNKVDDVDEELSGISQLVGDVITVENIHTQYLDNTAWDEGYYNWNSGHTKVNKVTAEAPWYLQKIEGLTAGTYYFNAFCSPGFTFFIDKTTGVVSRASDLGVTQGVAGNLTFTHDFDAYITIYDSATMPLESAMFADGGLPPTYKYGMYKSVTDASYVTPQGHKILVVGTADNNYSTIQAACDAATDGDIIFIRCGTYTEQVSIWTRKLHLIGEDKLNTILIDHSGNYDTPPLEMAMGSLSNLTIIEDGTTPTVEPSDGRYMMAYCLHIEHPNAAGEAFEIDNVNFINYIHVPLGCGLRANNTVRFRNCRFYCGATNESVSQERGAFFVHAVNAENAENQWIIAENCTMESKGPRLAAMFGVPSGANNTGHMYIRLSNCCLWNENRGIADNAVTFDTIGGADVMKLSHSYGNTINALNGNDS